MKVGVPKKIKNNESRVGMTPAGVFELVNQGYTVYLLATAREGIGFSLLSKEVERKSQKQQPIKIGSKYLLKAHKIEGLVIHNLD